MDREVAMNVLTLAEAAEPARPGNDEAHAAALRAVGNLVEPAIEYLQFTDPPAALRLVGALTTFWLDTGQIDDGRRLTDDVVKQNMFAAARDDAIAQAIPRAILASSELAFRQGDQKAAAKRAHATIRAAVLVEDYATASLARKYIGK